MPARFGRDGKLREHARARHARCDVVEINARRRRAPTNKPPAFAALPRKAASRSRSGTAVGIKADRRNGRVPLRNVAGHPIHVRSTPADTRHVSTARWTNPSRNPREGMLSCLATGNILPDLRARRSNVRLSNKFCVTCTHNHYRVPN